METQTATCPQCGRTIKVRTNRFGDKTYARHKMETSANLDKKIFSGVGNDNDAAREESWSAPNPLAFGLHEIDCPMSGQMLEL